MRGWTGAPKAKATVASDDAAAIRAFSHRPVKVDRVLGGPSGRVVGRVVRCVIGRRICEVVDMVKASTGPVTDRVGRIP